jgi:Dolichyl-phosphate-mannose-protein mannosyltransferase
MTSAGRQRAVLLLLLALCFVVRLLSMPDKVYTYDEGQHLYYGHQILNLKSDRLEAELWVSKTLSDGWHTEIDGQELRLVKGNRVFRYTVVRTVEGGWDVRGLDASKMPISALNALPGKIGSLFPRLGNLVGGLSPARFVTVLTSLFLGYLCFHWSRKVYGFGAGLFTLFLFAFEPNLIAHSQLITTDLYGAATMTLALYTSWRYSLAKDTAHAAAVGVALGLSQLAKYSAVFLWILIPAILLLADSRRLMNLIQAKDGRTARDVLGRMVRHGGLVLLIALLMINAGYFFNRTLTPLHEYHFQSDLFQSLQSALSSARFIRIPLPYPYLEGLDLVSFEERTGFGYGRVYLLGQLSREGFLGYYLFAFLFKVPLAIQVLCLLAALSYVAHWKSNRFRRAELFILVPLLFFTVYLNLFNRAQNGIRFLLIIFPCIFVFCGSLIAGWSAINRSRKLGILVLGLYLVVSVLSYFPHYIPYFNELVYDRRSAYKVLADSNIDWGQGGGRLAQYLRQHPTAQVHPAEPAAGRIVVDVNHLTGTVGDPERYAWLRENFFPSATIAHAYLVYDVSIQEVQAISPYYRNH